MTPLHPRDAFGSSHIVALLAVGIDALARDIRGRASHDPTRGFNEADEFDLALLGLCALADRIHDWGGASPPNPAGSPTAAPDRMLR